MTLKLVSANAVVTARLFNPSVFSQIWLVQNGIAREADFKDDFAFTPAFAQVNTEAFVLLILQERLQFIPRVEETKQQELILDKVGRIVRALPHTPFQALGMNFSFSFVPRTDVREFTRSMFFVPGSPIHTEFDTQDARFGGYLSKDVLGCRLKCEVKPALAKLEADSPEVHCLAMEFNYHLDLKPCPESADEIYAMLGQWNNAFALAWRLAQKIAERDK